MTRGSLLAVGLSLTLHATALFALAGRPSVHRDQPVRPRPVELEVLRLAAVISPSRAAPQNSATRVAAVPGVARVASPARPASLAPPPMPAAGLTLPVGSPVTDEPPAPTEPGEPAGQRAGSAVAATAPPPGGNEPKGAALDTTELSRRLQQGARHCYPKAAERFRQRGTVEVSFCLDGAGALRTPTVAGSSGFALLDTAATSCVVPGAAPFEEPAFGRCFTLAVRF